MHPAVADTGPLNYLILIEAVDVLPRLFSPILIPTGVQDELRHPKAPAPVRSWVERLPVCLNVVSPGAFPAAEPSTLDLGERQAIALAAERQATLLLDDRDGVLQARRMGLKVVGTLAILARAVERGWVDLPEMFRRLRATSFRSPVHLMARMLEDGSSRKKEK